MGYVFDVDELEAAVQTGIGKDPEAAMDAITADLARRYPGRINTKERDWILNNAGGAMGQITLLYCSLNEYLLFFGTPIGTEGHSGRYGTDVYDWVFDGEMWCYVEGETERTLYKPGSRAYLGKSLAKGYRIPDRAWMLEYSRGPIPSMLPFGLADSLVSTLDLRSLGKTLAQYTREVARSTFRR